MRILFVLFLFACATPRYAVPGLDEELTQSEAARVTREAYDLALARRARVYDLAWPVLTANAALCPDASVRAGLVLADRKLLAEMAGGMEEAALAVMGVEEGLRLVHVNAGSPAEAAALVSGMMIDAVEGEPVGDPEEAAKLISSALKERGEATIVADGRTYTFGGTEACDVPVKIGTSQELNAHAIDGVTIYTGLVRSLGDEALRSVIAHELAHVALGHKAAYIRNSVVTGGAVLAPALYTLGGLIDRALGLVGAEPDRSYAGRALRLVVPWTEDFEAEADYVGLYMHARAGGDLEAAAAAFELFGTEAPKSLTIRSTHPLVPERLARLRATIEEIEEKRAAGDPLVPELKR
ncbi:M48 family metallopeptidase [Parvularcula dongshanensis]|uniref:Putative Zn-dependent protease n=1 Tax=Parvularcula dongshanensis TaxID=1173995 RepID=A0A840I604_9PROT|nr:M48 family metallopeptidase [Parvularcula dongshanensis]MBB4659842.1 putative Zn-dependent protease [Parvularcula dongshanensis]